MSFADIRNNEGVIRRLKESIARGELPHAYILEGPATVDKKAFAVSFAQALLCRERPGEGCGICPLCRRIAEGNHLDVSFIEGEQKKGRTVSSVKDEDVQRIQERLAAKPMEGERNIAIIKDADSMTVNACNRFLKTLEEPAPGTVILLLSENKNRLPATIRSRCVSLRLSDEGEEGSGDYGIKAEELLRALDKGAPYYRLCACVAPFESEREKAATFLDALEGRCGVYLKETKEHRQRELLFRSVEALEQARAALYRGDKVSRVLRKMLLDMGGQI